MDLLGSILGSMDKPPQASEQERLARKKQKEIVSKMEAKEKEAKKQFREGIEKKINDFIKDGEKKTTKFPPMDKYKRSIIHDVAEIAGLTTFTFGEEDVDRHIQVWKKEFAPCEGELAALRRGEEWDPVKEQQRKADEEWKERFETERARTLQKIQPKTNYKDKYQHLIGSESAIEAAKKTETNKSYGMVSSELKKDKRTVEQVQAEIRAKKLRRLEGQPDVSSLPENI